MKTFLLAVSLSAAIALLPNMPVSTQSASIMAANAAATPLTLGVTGGRSLAVSNENTLWVLDGGIAPREPFGPPATPLK